LKGAVHTLRTEQHSFYCSKFQKKHLYHTFSVCLWATMHL